jgi:hypothetical protein
MASSKTEKRVVCGGLMRDIMSVLARLNDIEEIKWGEMRGYRGDRKVRIAQRWQNRCLAVSVCDGDNGERTILVHALKPGAIGRILSKRLEERGITVC